MANHSSALKRVRQTQNALPLSRNNTSQLRGSLPRTAPKSWPRDDRSAAAEKTYRETVSALDKAIQKGVIHKNTAARYKSRLSKRVRAVGAK